jgi:hypothetical protein
MDDFFTLGRLMKITEVHCPKFRAISPKFGLCTNVLQNIWLDTYICAIFFANSSGHPALKDKRGAGKIGAH